MAGQYHRLVITGSFKMCADCHVMRDKGTKCPECKSPNYMEMSGSRFPLHFTAHAAPAIARAWFEECGKAETEPATAPAE